MTPRQAWFTVAVATLLLISARADCAWFGHHANNKTVCETALDIFDRGTPQQRQGLQDYIYATFGDINMLNLQHHGADIGSVIVTKPYDVIWQEIVSECQTDLSMTVFAAVGRTYKREANPELAPK